MKAIMISDHAKWCALMMNGIKNIEVRKNKALASAIQKLIDKYGYAEIYVYCTKNDGCVGLELGTWKAYYLENGKSISSGKVVFKFRCYKVEEIACNCLDNGVGLDAYYMTEDLDFDKLEKASCLTNNELRMYLGIGKNIQSDIVGYAIHISDLEIFDKPKKLSEFYRNGKMQSAIDCKELLSTNELNKYYKLTKAPQNYQFIEVE